VVDREHGSHALEGGQRPGREKAVVGGKVTGEGAGATRAYKGRSALFSRGPLFPGPGLNLAADLRRRTQVGRIAPDPRQDRETWKSSGVLGGTGSCFLVYPAVPAGLLSCALSGASRKQNADANRAFFNIETIHRAPRGNELRERRTNGATSLPLLQANRTTETGPVAGSTVRAPRGWRRRSRSRRARSGSTPRKRFR